MIKQNESVTNYIKNSPTERQEALSKIRQVILKNIPKNFEETIIYNMIGYVVPKSVYPKGYHCGKDLPLPFINVASQKNFIALYHMGIYAKPELYKWFVNEYPNHCKYKLDMGKSCIRFKRLNDIPYKLIEALIKKMTAEQWIKIYEKAYLK